MSLWNRFKIWGNSPPLSLDITGSRTASTSEQPARGGRFILDNVIHSGPKSTATGGESITLKVKDEQTARNLCNDQYFLLGALMSDSSSEARRFLQALRRGGTYRYEVRRNSVSGECEVRMWMRS